MKNLKKLTRAQKQRICCNKWKEKNREKLLQYNKDYYRKNKHNGKWAYKPVIKQLKQTDNLTKYLEDTAPKEGEPKIVRSFGKFVIDWS